MNVKNEQAYIDNDIVSAIAKDDTPAESDAIDQLVEAHEKGLISLITSELTLEEIKSYHGPGRKRVERTFRLLEKIPVARWDKLYGMHSYGDARTWITSPLIQNDALYDQLLGSGLKAVDLVTFLPAPSTVAGLFSPATVAFSLGQPRSFV